MPDHLGEGQVKRLLPWLLLLAMIASYVGFAGWLSTTRHAAFETNALDLGYTAQALWNTAHGRPFEFTTFEGARYQFDIPLQDVRHRDILLSYHVEPLLLLVAPLVAILPSIDALLWLQTIGLALGAVPAYLLARKRLSRPRLALVFPLLYLIAPSIMAANLSDFHAVAFSPLFLLSAYVALDARHWKTFTLFCVLALLCKEDIALLVAMLGLCAAWSRRPRWIGFAMAAAAVAWFVLATQVISPGFSGLGHSPFLVRYNQFGTSAGEVLRHAMSWPNPLLAWLTQPAVLRYGALLLGMGGGIVLLGPQGWVLALPVIVANALSNYAWMHSGGGHYSASIVAFLVIAAIEGAAWIDRRVGRPAWTTAAVWLALGVGLLTHYWVGVSPVARNWNPPQVTDHDRLLSETLTSIPPDAEVIAQSALYPHVALRRRAVLFPTRAGADVVALDVTSTTYPWSMNKFDPAVNEMLERPGYRVTTARDGIIILECGDGPAESTDDPGFASFAFATDEPQFPAAIRFDSGLVLDGYAIERPSAVSTAEAPWAITTFWHVDRPQLAAYRPVLFFTKPDGALGWAYDEGTPTDLWFDTARWTPGARMQVSFPPLDLSEFTRVLVGVVIPAGDTWATTDRLQTEAGSALEPLDQGTLAVLFDLSR